MSDTNLQKTFAEKGYLPHQAEFAASFFASGAPIKHLLVSAVGAGRAFTSAAIVNYALSSGLAHRVLFLAPSNLRHMWYEVILQGNPAAEVMIVDRRRLRELEDSHPVGEEIWPAHAVVILSFDFAKQADVAPTLVRSPWDLLVVDEVHLASQRTARGKLLLDLMHSFPQMRILMLRGRGYWAGIKTEELGELYSNAAVTIWDRETLHDQQGEPLFPEVLITWLPYRRTPEEVGVLSKLQESLQSFTSAYGHMRLTVANILQAASSSLFALEQQLHRIRQRRNELVHGVGVDMETEFDTEDLGMEETDVSDIGRAVLGYVELAIFSEPLLKMLDELATDSKYHALLNLLDSLGPLALPEHRVLVLTKFFDTATYLENLLRETYSRVRVLTGRHSFTDRSEVLFDFVQEGGILIATESVQTQVPEVTAVVFYDLPLSPAALEARMDRFVRVGRRSPIRIFAFTDESNALLIEPYQRKIVELNEPLSEREIEQALSTKQAR
jgi:hypothetical protein